MKWYGPVAISGLLFFLAAQSAKYGDLAEDPLVKGISYAIAAALYIGTFIAVGQGWIIGLRDLVLRR